MRVAYRNVLGAVAEHVDVSNDSSGPSTAPFQRGRHSAAAASRVRRMICRLNVDEELYRARIRVQVQRPDGTF